MVAGINWHSRKYIKVDSSYIFFSSINYDQFVILAFGGNLRLMVVASAPLAGNVLTFMRCALGCLVVEGYGQTECTGAITLTVQGDFVPNHVGPPVSCNAIKVIF